jgi:hypothetical protein
VARKRVELNVHLGVKPQVLQVRARWSELQTSASNFVPTKNRFEARTDELLKLLCAVDSTIEDDIASEQPLSQDFFATVLSSLQSCKNIASYCDLSCTKDEAGIISFCPQFRRAVLFHLSVFYLTLLRRGMYFRALSKNGVSPGPAFCARLPSATSIHSG